MYKDLAQWLQMNVTSEGIVIKKITHISMLSSRWCDRTIRLHCSLLNIQNVYIQLIRHNGTNRHKFKQTILQATTHDRISDHFRCDKW